MTIDKDGLAAAHEAYAKTVGGTMEGHPMANAITAYLSALPNTGDELVARLRYRVNNPSAWESFDQDGSDLMREAADAIEFLRGQTFKASAEAAEFHRDNAVSMWHDEKTRREAAEASLASAREDALEEAAKLIETGFDREGIDTKHDKCPHGLYGWEDCEQCAATAIRALKEVR